LAKNQFARLNAGKLGPSGLRQRLRSNGSQIDFLIANSFKASITAPPPKKISQFQE
jgi:signal transduction histidine kinase